MILQKMKHSAPYTFALCVLITLFCAATPVKASAESISKTDIGIGGGFWLPGDIDVEGVTVDKEASLLIRLFVDTYVAEKFAIGAYGNFSNPTVSYGSIEESGTMFEFGGAFKYCHPLNNGMALKAGVNIGYRMLESDAFTEDVDGLGVNLSVELQFNPKDEISYFVEGGFLSQPAGGNQYADVTWAPIIYLAGGVVF